MTRRRSAGLSPEEKKALDPLRPFYSESIAQKDEKILALTHRSVIYLRVTPDLREGLDRAVARANEGRHGMPLSLNAWIAWKLTDVLKRERTETKPKEMR